MRIGRRKIFISHFSLFIIHYSYAFIFAWMARILAIDYGGKRSGIAVTDPLKLIATGLCTVETPKLVGFLKEYTAKEEVELVIVGLPMNLDDSPTDATPLVQKF